MRTVVRSEIDRVPLARAVALAQAVHGAVAPNPPVGCVLVADGMVVGEGSTRPPGGPHAEAVALAEAGPRAVGATAHVTLEPCAHHGRTPPCADALASAGVARVVVGMADPHPQAAGGRQRLRAAGVEVLDAGVTFGPLWPQMIAAQLEGFVTCVRAGRPHVTLKLAQTPDGRLTPAPGRRWVTGPAARRAVHRWRASVDGVLVGIGTVLADDPGLDVRLVETRHPQPRAIVLDTHLRTPPDAVVARPGTLVVHAGGEATRARRLIDAGVEVLEVERRGDHLDLPAALARLAGAGLSSVLAEPGGTLAAALVGADLVDRLVLHVAGGPDPVQDAGSTGTENAPPERAVGAPPGRTWRTERAGGAGEDLVLHLAPDPAR